MIRSTSKLLKKGGSVRNLNKVGSRFRVSIEFETCTRLLANSDVVVTWERKGVVLATDPVKVDRNSRTADFSGSKLTQIITLFKPKKGGDEFDEKAYMICVRTNNDKGKVIGRIYLNFAEYVAVPEYTKRMMAKLSHDGELIMRVVSTYVGEAKKRRGSQGSSSVSSITLGGASKSGSASVATDPEDQSDLTDLEVPDFDSEPSSSRITRPKKDELVSSSSKRQDRERPRGHNRSASTSGALAPSPSLTRRERERAERAERSERDNKRQSVMIPTVSTMDESISSRAKASGNGNSSYGSADSGSSSRPAITRAEFEKVKRENRALIRKNNDLQLQNDELEEKLANAGLNSNVGKVEMLEGEVDRLRKEVRDLKSRLTREPVYADVVRELKDAKMALAILSTENAELKSRRRMI